ncbi:hypothetical protein KOM07_09380 [Lentilactobacillus sp. G22-6]|uniref:spr1630 family ClpXP-sensitive toxin n=1 Tax=Lentilactobacillus dabitei TaxID=2831523 RepID=UPI001C26392C|nr:hypothetical protein [Lentilactobacillus dabitei]MBU9789744.1 hypothetical protein [Lentilactobacillus dabitei]
MSELPMLNNNIKKLLVDATRAGFVEFLEEKVQKQESMKVSGGYAWTRSDHIDNYIAQSLDETGLGNYTYHKVAAWDSLRFEFKVGNKKIWIAQKGSTFLRKNGSLAKREDLHKNYISQWSENINEQYSALFNGKSEQLNLLNDALDLTNTQNNSERESSSADAFYLLIYNISNGIDIDKMSLNLVYNGQIKLIEDLSELNASSDIKIPDEYRNNNELSEELDPEKELSSTYPYYDNQEIRNDKEREEI